MLFFVVIIKTIIYGRINKITIFTTANIGGRTSFQKKFLIKYKRNYLTIKAVLPKKLRYFLFINGLH